MYRNVDMTSAEMRKLREEGYSNAEIAELAGCSVACVWDRIGKGGRSKRAQTIVSADREIPEIAESEKKPDELRPKQETFALGKDNEICVNYERREMSIFVGNFDRGISFENVPELVRTLAIILRQRIEPRMNEEKGEE